MIDHAENDRQEFIRQSMAWKLERAKRILGKRWVFHPANTVRRIQIPKRVLG